MGEIQILHCSRNHSYKLSVPFCTIETDFSSKDEGVDVAETIFMLGHLEESEYLSLVEKIEKLFSSEEQSI